MSLSPHIRRYFWDLDPQKAQPKSHPKYYIKRILEMGDAQALSWLKIVFGKKKIKKMVGKARLSPKSKNFWEQTL